MEIIIAFIKLLITFLASLFFGLERQRSHKPVGFGTFIFVSVGACALGIIVVSGTILNTVSLLAAVVTGIGFLGAGALIRGPDKVFGFTTAASIWLFAIFGLTLGVGEYLIGLFVYVIMWVVVLFDHYLEDRGIGSYQRRLVIRTNRIISEKEIHRHLLLHTKRHRILSSDINKDTKEMVLSYLINGGREKLNKLSTELYKEEWLKSLRIE